MRSLTLLLLGGLGMGLLGCAGYQVGPTGGQQAGSRSVQVNPFINKTQEPRLTAAVTSSLRKRLQQDGTYRLDTGNQGDIVIDGTILELERSGVSFQPRDVVTPRDYSLTLKARIKAVERSSGRLILERDVVGRTTVRVLADLNSAERQAVPLMADDLARKATSLLVDGSW